MLLAEGPDPTRWKSARSFQGAEGRAISRKRPCCRRRTRSWRLFYEFARDGASRLGMARAEKLGVNWTAMEEMVPIREDSWDNWHLSPGPIIQQEGATR